MRFLLGRRASAPDAGQRSRDRKVAQRQSRASVLTRWLRQGLQAGMCPLCRVAHKADREYMWHFFDEGDREAESIDQLRASCGFCSEHIEMLRRIEVEQMKSDLGISAMFAEVLAGVVEDLEALSGEDRFKRAACPACAKRDEVVEKNAGYLLDELATAPGRRAHFERSPGLCFAHFELTWRSTQTASERELLLEVQRRATGELLGELREHVRKQDHKFAHEPKGAERDSWERAIYLTAGWPPPSESAGKPENR